MAFRCPQCMTPDSLEIFNSIELPPDRQAHEISLQVVCCAACSFRGLAVYSEGRANIHELQTWQHIGYWVSPDAVDSVLSRSAPAQTASIPTASALLIPAWGSRMCATAGRGCSRWSAGTHS